MSAITIDSSRFGTIEIPADSVIEFPHGLVGLGGHRYAIVPNGTDGAFSWLHSIDDPSLALPVTNPGLFFPDYEVEISDSEAERVGIQDPADAQVFVTVRAAEAVEDFRANLRAPLLVVGRRGYQVINEAAGTQVRAPLFAEARAAEQVA